MKKILLLLALFLCTGLTAQAQQIEFIDNPSGVLYVFCNEYTNNYSKIWFVNIGQNKKVKVDYAINTEANYDKVEVYSVSTSGATTLLFSESGNKSGTVYSAYATGQIQVKFVTDESVSCSGTQYSGFELFFRADDRTTFSGPINGNLAGGALRVQTTHGYLDLGPQNTSEAHLSTDRSRFLLNKPLFLQTGTLSAYSTSNMYFQTNGTNRMTILNTNGNVGIGTTSPTAKLHIVNNQAASSNLYGISTSITNTDLNSTANTVGAMSSTTISGPGTLYGSRLTATNNNTTSTTSSYGARISITSQNQGAIHGHYIVAKNENTASTASSFGEVINISSKNQGGTYGQHITVGNDNTSSTASTYGIRSKIDVSGSGAVFGSYETTTNSNETSTSATYGARTEVSSQNKGSTYGHYISSKNTNTSSTANVFGIQSSVSSSSTVNTVYGVYSSVSGGSKKWAGYFTGGDMYVSGCIGIGTTNPNPLYKLDVNGTVKAKKIEVAGTLLAREVKIDVNAGADFVFAPDYNLKPLSEIESFIQTNKHLPEIPSEKAMQEDGLSINEFQIKLLQKIEELTLYAIEQNKTIEELKKEVQALKETR